MSVISGKLERMLATARAQKIIHIEDLRAAQKKAEDDARTIHGPEDFGPGLHPFHAVYASVQNYAAALGENLASLNELDEFSARVARATDTYVPGYPPMSPVTDTFFSFWAIFDVRFGPAKETIGSCIVDLAEVLGLAPEAAELIQNLSSSRMGIYVHRGEADDGTITLEEVYTGKAFRCHSGSGYQGAKDEIWFVRLAPPPFGMGDLHLALTTPYVVRGFGPSEWLAFLERTVARLKMTPPVNGYHHLMKFGLIPEYWHEYVFQAYSNYQSDAVFLSGIPDRPETLPLFDESSSMNTNLAKVRTDAERHALRKTARKKLRR